MKTFNHVFFSHQLFHYVFLQKYNCSLPITKVFCLFFLILILIILQSISEPRERGEPYRL